MAKSIKFRSFNDGNSDVQFSSILFRSKLKEWRKRGCQSGNPKEMTIEKCQELIADKAHVSVDAVKNWYKGHNGPSDLQTVKLIATTLEIDYKDLLVDSDTKPKHVEQDFTPIGSNEKDFVIQMYKLFIDYIYWFIGNKYETYAFYILENPTAERAKYIWNLYHYLDQIALSVSDETYMKLRRIIAELENMPTAVGAYTMTLPPLWLQLNPNLKHFWASLGEFDDDSDKFLDVVEINEAYELLHSYVEDLPFLVDEYKEMYRMNNRPLPDNYVIEALICDRSDELPPPYQLYTREVANTLKMVMKYMFPQYFDQFQRA